jgi:RHS repeat-associated protein
LLSAFALPAPAAGETGTASAGINYYGGLEAGGYVNGSANDGSPKAFVTIVIFDKKYNFIDVSYQRVANSGDLLSATYIVKEPGYAFMYVSNENSLARNVYFDDVVMTHKTSAVIAMNDYYSFGAEFNSFERENAVPNRYKFNAGSELVNDLDLQVYLTDHRVYDPWGRIGWWQVDPKTDAQESWSPYHFSYDNPIRYNDPKGDCPPGFPCSDLFRAAVSDAVAHPDGIGAHALGVGMGLGNSAGGLVNAVTHPGETLQGLGNLAVASFAGNPAAAMQIDNHLGTNSYGTMMGLSQAVANGANNLVNGNGIQRGTVLGEIGGAILGSKGVGLGLKLGGNALSIGLRSVTTSDGFLFGSMSIKAPFNIPVQRFGAMSIGGQSAFGLRTGSSVFSARAFNAILPRWNNLTNYTTGIIPRGTSIRIGITAPQGLRFPGGLPQINVRPRLVTNQSTTLLNR